MRWADERYVRLYTRDTIDWHFLSFEAQGLFCLLLRKVDRAGIIELGKHGKRGVAAVIGHPTRADALAPALEELLNDGCLVIRDNRLIVPNFIEAQETPSSPAQRKRDQRERDRDVALDEEDTGSRPVTNRDDPSRNVANTPEDGHAASRAVTPSRTVPSRTVLNQPQPPPTPSAPDSAAAAAADEFDPETAPFPPPTAEVFWGYVSYIRREQNLPREKAPPKGFQEWFDEAAAVHGAAALVHAFREFIADQDFALKRWPTAVFLADAVWGSRLPQPEARSASP